MFDDDGRPKKKTPHVLGEELSALSLDELGERVEILKNEIGRLEEAIKAKQASAHVAASFFKT